ncbi:MAG: diguanylate cyclase, partial [Gammaproteobacteria bacterium]|nr:diguanylate cyclase [Gammaproteobacteria bacterium]
MADHPPKNSLHGSSVQRIENAEESSKVQAALAKHPKINLKLADNILGSLTEMVIAVDAKRHITFINAAAEKIFNWNSKNVLGLNIDGLLEIVDSSDNTWVDNPVGECLNTQKMVEIHGISLIDPEGKGIPVNIMATLLTSNTPKEAGVVLLIRNVTGTRRLQDKLEHQATHDTLTNLWNRRAFEHRLTELQSDAKLNSTSHALLYIDLDQFKIVNDTAGHLAGDELLKQICLQIKSCLRTADMLARLGGDEFGVLLSSCRLNDALGVGEKIRAILDGYQFVWEGNMYKVGSSIGVAILDRSTADMNILGLADMACYSAKEAGRNRVHLYTPDDKEQADRQGEMNMIAKVRSAIENDRLILYSQAIVPLQADKNRSNFREILVRMLDENGKIIPPEA